jgi:hypothetical protein
MAGCAFEASESLDYHVWRCGLTVAARRLGLSQNRRGLRQLDGLDFAQVAGDMAAREDFAHLGSFCEQRSKAWGQRVWKRQPGGGLIGLGTSPFKMTRFLAASGSGPCHRNMGRARAVGRVA